MTTAGLLRAASLSNYCDVAIKHGLHPPAMLRAAGLSLGMLAQPDRQIPVEAVCTLLEASADASGNPCFGLQMAQSRHIGNLGMVSLLFSNQGTLRDMLHNMVQHSHLVNTALALDLEQSGHLAVLRGELMCATPAYPRQAIELLMGVIWRAIADIFTVDWRPRSINFMHAAPPSLALHQRTFRCPLHFDGEFNGLVFAAADLGTPNPRTDPAMGKYAQTIIEALPAGAGERTLVPAVRKAICLLLPMGQASITQAALGLGLNERTLQRRLMEEQASFSGLINDVRREFAVRHLDNRRNSIEQVAHLLGYTAPTSFTRWFIAQFGASPAGWRKQRRAQEIGNPPLR